MSDVLTDTSRSKLRWLLALAAWFCVTRLLFGAFGVAMPESGAWLANQWQLYDLDLLQTDLLRTLWYGHAQPPLFNLMIGLLLKVVPLAALSTALHACFFLLSAGLCWAMFELLLTVGVSQRWSAAVVALYAVSPSLLIYENWAFNTLPVAFALTLFGLALVKADASGARRWAIGAVWAMACLCLLRSSYHLLLLVLISAFVLWRCGWRTTLLAVAVPVVLVTGFYLKNLVLFGSFGSSSWLGMNLYNVVRIATPEAHACAAQRAGDSITSVVPFKELPQYASMRPPLRQGAPPADHPVLTAAWKRGDTSSPNFNHWHYLEISQRYGNAFRAMLACAPREYVQSVRMGFVVMAMPADEYRHTFELRRRFDRYAVWYDRLIFWSPQLAYNPALAMRSKTGFQVFPLESSVLVIGFLIALALTWARLTAGKPVPALAGWPRAGLWVLATLILGHVVMSNLLEFGENNRFRFEWEPLMAVLVGSALAKLVPESSATDPV